MNNDDWSRAKQHFWLCLFSLYCDFNSVIYYIQSTIFGPGLLSTIPLFWLREPTDWFDSATRYSISSLTNLHWLISFEVSSSLQKRFFSCCDQLASDYFTPSVALRTIFKSKKLVTLAGTEKEVLTVVFTTIRLITKSRRLQRSAFLCNSKTSIILEVSFV